jgi:two-component system, OmpR family, sensor kinase
VSLPVRARLTLWYAALLAVILLALGAFLLVRLAADLEATLDRNIQRAANLAALGYATAGTPEFRQTAAAALPRTGAVAQIADRAGHVLVSFGDARGSRPIVPPDVRATAIRGHPSFAEVELDGLGPFRAYTRSVRRLGRQQVLMVAESLQDADEPVRRVRTLLLLAGSAALAATLLVGWWVARKALVPVDRMASEARAIDIDRLEERIAVPQAADELRDLALTLNAMLDRLELGVTAKRRLVSDASHELRTPLAVMRAELDVSLRDEALPGGAREVLESAREEVDRMTRTVDNLLTLAQADEGRLALLRGEVELREATAAAVRPLLPLAEHKGIRLDTGGESSTVHADPQRVHLALTNLIDNAIKFTPAGGEGQVTAWRTDSEAGVTVSDNGPGIPADAQAHLFERFFRADAARVRGPGGSGLGLAICSEVARAHGGRVSIESEEGRGSVFTFTLPRDGAG